MIPTIQGHESISSIAPFRVQKFVRPEGMMPEVTAFVTPYPADAYSA